MAVVDITDGAAALCFANITPTYGKLPFEKEVVSRFLQEASA